MSDKDLAKELEILKAAGSVNKNIDISALMMNALERQQENKIPASKRRIAYLVSLAFPPFGLIFAVRYFFSEYSDGKKVALVCAVLTLFVITFTTIVFNIIISSSGQSIEQLQQAPAELRSLLE